jgi:hypothetical protein
MLCRGKSLPRANGGDQETDCGADQDAGGEGGSRVTGDVVICDAGVAFHLGCGASALFVQDGFGFGHRCLDALAQFIELRAVFVVQSSQKLFNLRDQLLELSWCFQGVAPMDQTARLRRSRRAVQAGASEIAVGCLLHGEILHVGSESSRAR